MRDKSFLEILTEQIETRVREELSPQSSRGEAARAAVSKFDKVCNSHGDSPSEETFHDTFPEETPSWIQQIPLGKIEFQRPRSQVFGRVYPVNTPRKRPLPSARPRRKHTLNEQQAQAWAYFFQWKTGLREDFTSEELRRAFRQLAHRLHPDRNQGQSSHYLELKLHYETLKNVPQENP
ncbi:MAG: J domain-containing protein [Bdellovibrionales bacterium]